MYISVTVPSIRTVVTPIEGVDTHHDQIDALRVLSAGNTLIMVLLGGVLALQVRGDVHMYIFPALVFPKWCVTENPDRFLSEFFPFSDS